ncbi:MAG: putative heme transporter [Solirubrobacteraceae bacterium]|nr:putative heme transporter [Solirubrobacteraceae bacterium]
MSVGTTDDPSRTTVGEPRDETGVDVGTVVRRVGLFAVVLIIALIAIATLPGVGEVRQRLTSADPWWIGVTALCSLGSMLGFAAALSGAFDAAVPLNPALLLGFAEQGANVLLPAGGAGGPALGTVVMRRAGVPPELAAERHVALFLVTSSVSFAALVIAGLLVGIGALPGDAGPLGTFLPAGLGFAVLVTAWLFAHTRVPPEPPAERRMRHKIWRLRRFLHGGVNTSLHLLRNGQPLFILGAIAYYAFDVGALAASFQAFGGGAPPLGEFILAYTIGHAGALLPTPGGVGGTDGGLIGMFVVYGTPLSVATAAVLGYRVFQLGMPVVLGSVSLLRIRVRLGDQERRAAVQARFAELGH